MGKDSAAAQKSRNTHAEEHEPTLSAEVWISLMQGKLKDLPPGKQDPKHLHIQSAYDRDHFPQWQDAKQKAEEVLAVSFPHSKGTHQKHIGDGPAGISWYGDHKGTGFDPKPNDDERKVL
jgi:hypothetical protein